MIYFESKRLHKAIATLVWGALTTTSLLPLNIEAANNRLSNVVTVNTPAGTEEYVDLVVNTDWDYDANVIQVGTGVGDIAPRTVDREFIETIIRQTARTLFVMTNGRHRVGKVYIFKNSRFGSDVDIRLLNTPGRSNASVSGWRTDGGFTSNNYLTFQFQGGQLGPELPEATGEVVAHEMGHYIYGLLDEYVEVGNPCKAPAEQGGFPCQDDLPKPTAMQDQTRSYRLSLPSDYEGTPAFRTAQARGYGNANGTNSSAWEMLLADPATDNENAQREHQGRRIRFDAFKNIPMPTLANMKRFESDGSVTRFLAQSAAQAPDSVFFGYDKYLQFIYEGGNTGAVNTQARPRNVIIVDRTVDPTTFGQLIVAAKGLVDRAGDNARFALLTSPSAGTPQFIDMNAQGKANLKAQLDGLTQVNGAINGQQLYDQGKNLVLSARPAAGQPAEDAGNSDVFSVYTRANVTVPEGLGAQARADKIAINIMAFNTVNSPTLSRSLANLASESGGVLNTARNANEAIKEADKALKTTMGMTEALITADLSDDTVKAGSTFEVPFRVGSEANDGKVEVRFYFSESDRGKLTFSCAPASGGAPGVVTIDPAEAGVDEGLATCTIQGTRTVGNWLAKATVANGRGDAEAVEVEVVSIPKTTPIEVSASIQGGTVASKMAPTLNVTFSGQFPIINATIDVGIYNSLTGALVKTYKLTSSNDQGTNGDARANDGVYTQPLSGQLNAGDYYAVIEAVTDPVNSKFNPVQRFVNGVAPAATAVGDALLRLADAEFSLEQNAPGVGVTSTATPVASSGSGGGGGGCTTGGGSDAGLITLLGLASLRLAARLRRRKHNRN